MNWDSEYSPYKRKESITPVKNEIVLYGTSWCGMTQIIRRYLDKLGLQYKFLDIESDPSVRRELKWVTGGYASHPTVVVDGQALIEPEIDELEITLTKNGYI